MILVRRHPKRTSESLAGDWKTPGCIRLQKETLTDVTAVRIRSLRGRQECAGPRAACAYPGRGGALPDRVPRLGQQRIQAPRRRGFTQGARRQSGAVLQSPVPVARRGRAVACGVRRASIASTASRAHRVPLQMRRPRHARLATLKPGDELNMVGPLGVGFHLDPAWSHIVVLGRGVGLATLGPISQLAGRTASASPRSCPRAARIS